MGDKNDHTVKARHSIYRSNSPKHTTCSDYISKSEVHVVPKECNFASKNIRNRDSHTRNSTRSLGAYYKKYEHDEVPVKDLNFQDNIPSMGDKGSLTNSELDQLELKIFKNMSQELQTDDGSISSLDSNIKFFKTTVQEIFDNFYASMRDFEVYKNRFNEILAKNKDEAVSDMEDFIKDMIHHIMSSETSISHDSKKSNDTDVKSNFTLMSFKDQETNVNSLDVSSSDSIGTSGVEENSANQESVVEAFKNDNYLTDSTLDEKASKSKYISRKEEIFNIFLLSGTPCIQIKMNDRNLLSEINIKEPFIFSNGGKHVASAENMERLAAKRMELEKYANKSIQDTNAPDREIPVKVSYAKKDIHLNEDFSHDHDGEKSFISKICNFLCRKFRKTS